MELSLKHPRAVAVACQPDYTLVVEFDDGGRGLLDMKPYLDFGVFNELREPSRFKSARVVTGGAIIWGDGSIDLHPAFVYEKCRKGCVPIQQPDTKGD